MTHSDDDDTSKVSKYWSASMPSMEHIFPLDTDNILIYFP